MKVKTTVNIKLTDCSHTILAGSIGVVESFRLEQDLFIVRFVVPELDASITIRAPVKPSEVSIEHAN